jgi:hypothetical protein
MTTFEKLNLKHQKRIVVLNAPPGFEPALAALHDVAVLRNVDDLDGDVEFALAFVSRPKEVETLGIAVDKAKGDPVVWFAYPKGTSKNYRTEITRDTGWQPLGKLGFEAVRSVAIDEDWTALRFRRVEFIKTMTRSERGRMSAGGKARIGKK